MSYDPTDCELGICGRIHSENEENPQRAMPTDDFYNKREDQAAEMKEPIDTIDLTPSWVSVVRIYLEVLASDGSGTDAKGLAWEEIMRCARLADLYVKEHKP